MIEVGEYARTEHGEIGEVRTIIDERVFINTNQYWSHIVKHSKNIIDLIEAGDYVNGYKVLSIDKNAPECSECIELDRNNAYEYQWISKNNIKTILTHEQFEANCYKVERKKDEI